MKRNKKRMVSLLAMVGITFAFSAAGLARADAGKLGLTPWALIGSNAAAGETGSSSYLSLAKTRNYRLRTDGAAVDLRDRIEVTLNGNAPFGAAPGGNMRMQILGLKVRIAGDAVLDSHSLMPQISVGLQQSSLGTKTSGTDVYLSATKLFLAQGVLLNATLRATKAKQGGLPGPGSAGHGQSSYSLQPEFSVAYLLSRNLAIGAEYRVRSSNSEALGRSAGLGDALREDDWKDVFIAWAPNKNLSLTLAYVGQGRAVPGIMMNRRQNGGYLSAQLAF